MLYPPKAQHPLKCPIMKTAFEPKSILNIVLLQTRRPLQ